MKKIALALAGGGARGMAHIGAIEELEKAGYTITSISGTSIGSLVGGMYAAGKLDEFTEWVRSLDRLDVLRMMDVVISKNGLLKGEKVFKQIREMLGDVKIEELPLPYAAVAVDILRHEEIVFREGLLADAIRASVAVPTVLKPFHWKGRDLVDGGVLNPLPLDVIHRVPGDLLVAVDLNADMPYEQAELTKEQEERNQIYQKSFEFINEKWNAFFRNSKGKSKSVGFFDLATQSITAMQLKLTQLAIERYKPDLVIPVSKWACDLFEFHRTSELIEYGRRQARLFIPELEKKTNASGPESQKVN